MKVYGCRRKKKSASVKVDLPEEIIEKMLSYLPVKSLLRFKGVNKDWNSTIVDDHFISLHSENSSLVMYNKSEDDEFVALDECKGLLLEESKVQFPSFESSTYARRKYRIRNPETRRIVQLPHPQKNPSLHMCLAFLPSKQVFKVFSIYKDENLKKLGCEILSIGNESNISTCLWRLLELPTLQNAENVIKNCQISVTYQVAYCVFEVIDNSQNRTPAMKIDTVDLENETYIATATLPKGINFASRLTSDNYIQWNGKVSFGKLVNDKLHVLVLDDYKTNKWIEEKRIIKMKNLKEEDEPIDILCVIDFELYFLLPKKKSFCLYDFISEKVDIVLSDYDESKVLAAVHSSLYTLNGMQPI